MGGRVAHASSRYEVFDDVGYKKYYFVGVGIIIYYHTSMVWYHGTIPYLFNIIGRMDPYVIYKVVPG